MYEHPSLEYDWPKSDTVAVPGHLFECAWKMEVEEAINKLEQTLWTTKSIVTRKIKKSEETLVAPSDLELESRLELFSSIDETTTQTEIIMKIYKERLCLLASEEAALANFLRDVGKADKTGMITHSVKPCLHLKSGSGFNLG
ncbi:hypothetical protein QYM36_019886 [Artemia franciscana]|uniref:AH domain-containing protein n=1 Tax=Artemia franciscana TaxID=6661 RepID=A0AA88H9L9_ARTSF|nr:hypothetical protein QYM36_019886 [Artemia franciscana]